MDQNHQRDHTEHRRASVALPRRDQHDRPYAVELRGLTKSFGHVPAVRDLDLDIAAGEIVAVLGPNGAGKSTTTEMILGITQPDAGEVRVFGLDPRAAVLDGRVGAMLQAGALLQEATVSDVLKLMHGLHRRPLPLDAGHRAGRPRRLPQDQDRQAVGRPGPAAALRARDHARPGPADPRRADRGDGRRGAAGLLGLHAGLHRGRAAPCCSPPTTWRRPTRSPTGSSSWTTAGWWPTEPAPRSSPGWRVGRSAWRPPGSTRPSVAALPLVAGFERQGARLLLHTPDSDALLRVLLDTQPGVHDIEISSARLEDAFLALTAKP